MGNNLNKKDLTMSQTCNLKKIKENDKEIDLVEIIKQTFPLLKGKRDGLSIIARNKMMITGDDPYDGDSELNYKYSQRTSMRTTIQANNNTHNYIGIAIKYELNIKTADHIRQNYIAKLITKRIWEPLVDNDKVYNSIIIYDWDDTLLPTTALSPSGVFLHNTHIDESNLKMLTILESSVYKLLIYSIDRGDTFIITNAAPGWVEYSVRRFYPKIYPLLAKINIVSARGEYERHYPGDSRQWKILAFLNILRYLDTSLVTNLISVGDSIVDLEAAYILASYFGKAFTKTIKFRESPKPGELNKEIKLINKQFEKIFSSVKNLLIRIDKKSRIIKV
jgi:hypothetical protein